MEALKNRLAVFSGAILCGRTPMRQATPDLPRCDPARLLHRTHRPRRGKACHVFLLNTPARSFLMNTGVGELSILRAVRRTSRAATTFTIGYRRQMNVLLSTCLPARVMNHVPSTNKLRQQGRDNTALLFWPALSCCNYLWGRRHSKICRL